MLGLPRTREPPTQEINNATSAHQCEISTGVAMLEVLFGIKLINSSRYNYMLWHFLRAAILN
jgi:hypothetical protein